MSLHIGDRLLEVNGMPVKDQPLEKIESLLRSPDSTLQVIKRGLRHYGNLSSSSKQFLIHSFYLLFIVVDYRA